MQMKRDMEIVDVDRAQNVSDVKRLFKEQMTIVQRHYRATYSDVHVGFRTGAASPVGSIKPLFLGEEFFDTVAVKWYKATGLTTASWVALN